MKEIRKWQTNCVVTYHDSYSALIYRERVHALLTNLAFFRYIDCKIEHGIQDVFEDFFELNKSEPQSVVDIFYFRSSPQTQIPRVAFQKIVDLIFEEHQVWFFANHPFYVDFLLQKFLKDFPYPDD